MGDKRKDRERKKEREWEIKGKAERKKWIEEKRNK